MTIRSVLAGTGSYLPARVVTNQELAATVDTTDEWIVERTGIRERHIAAEGELTSDLAVRAAESALEAAGVKGEVLDLIIIATTTPDNTFPATATKVQARLGANRAMAFDVQAVCTGFVYALAIADNFIKVGQAKTALVIGAETLTRLVDWKDRTTCVLFGDGAGAVVLKAENNGNGASAGAIRNSPPKGILSTHLHSDGRHYDLLYVDGGPSSTQTTGQIRMDGRDVFRHAVNNLSSVLEEAMQANGVTAADIDWVVPHQANRRILDSTLRKLGLPEEKLVVTIDRHANTSAASIPLALDEAWRDGRIQPGQLILLEAMGGGLTWGAAVIRL
ncbi:MAG: ketoacyl-ACP synthase III [Rhodospirillales bacterium]|nr:ketoacyl-ACP synthase III [Rhodospirillales bacterium]